MAQWTLQQAFQLALSHHQAGRLRDAEQLYRQILAAQPEHAEALHLLGVIAHQVGEHQVAVDLIRRAISLKPEFPEAYSNLGNALRAMGQTNEAIAAYRHAIALQPAFPDALGNLGNALREKGRLDEAVKAYRDAAAMVPNSPEALNNLGNALCDQRQFDEAAATLRRAIALKPNLAEAHGNLGNVLRELGQRDEAIAAYRQAIAVRPGLYEVHNNLGNALRAKGTIDEAIAAFRHAIALKPEYAEAHSNLGNALTDKGQLNEAIAAYQKAIALDAKLADAHGGLGIALSELGQFEQAAECLRRALALRPDARFYKALALMGGQSVDSAEFDWLTGLVNEPGLSVDERSAAEFALGKWLDEMQRFDEAFEHFDRGNRMVKESRATAGERFQAAELRGTVDRAIEHFTPEFFAQRRQWGGASDLPVFIVGMPRSGTSLVEQIAASHSAVFGAGELADIEKHAAILQHGASAEAGSGDASPAEWNAEAIARAAQSYLEHLRELAGAAERITDKMPANVFQLGLIATMLHGARVIFCRRDARDNCLSCYFEQFARNNLLFSYDLADCGRQCVETNRLIAHWLSVLPLRMLEVQYETLVAEREAQSRRLIEFLGLKWDSACLEFHRTKRPVLTASAWQVRQPMYRRSVGRWRHYEKHLGPLIEALRQGQ
jgi:tetratricopeptide (TPR) repeat protein